MDKDLDIDAPQLRILSSKQFSTACESDLVAYCDPHDLVAVVTVQSDVVVYRINGQIAFTVKNPHEVDPETGYRGPEITALSWKQDGSRLAIGWTDGSYGIHSSEDGKLLLNDSVYEEAHQTENAPEPQDEFDVRDDLDDDHEDDEEDDEEHTAAVTRFGWMKYRLNTFTTNKDEDRDQQPSTDELNDTADQAINDDLEMSEGNDFHTQAGSIARLVRSVATLDVTETLPKLSAIPSHGLRGDTDSSKFSTQAATDAILEPQKDSSSEEVDLMFILGSNAKVHVLLDDAVRVGTCSVGWRPMMHAANTHNSAHAVMSHLSNEQSYHMSFVDLPLDRLGGPLLQVIAKNTKRMQNLLSYISGTIRCIQYDYTTGIQVPNRFIASANSTLADASQASFPVELNHLAMTGAFSPAMLEWLTDILREANHKRWDQAINVMYTNIQNHVFINLLPAIDRMYIAVTVLRGLARVDEDTSGFAIPPELFTRVLDLLDSLRLVAMRLQALVMDEKRQFSAFSRWLRVMIEVGVAGPGSKSGTETEEREIPNMDFDMLLRYINRTMTGSAVARHVETMSDMRDISDKDDSMLGSIMSEVGYGLTSQAMALLSSGQGQDHFTGHQRALEAALNFPAIVMSLASNVALALEAITTWQSRMVRAPTEQDIQTDPQVMVTDLSMDETGAVAALGISRVASQAHKLYVATTTNPPRLPTQFRGIAMECFDDTKIVDAKFVDGPDVVLLTKTGDDSFEVRRARFSAVVQGRDHGEDFTAHTLHVFKDDTSFEAGRIAVGGRKGKQVCVVMEFGGTGWRILDLDGHAEVAERDVTMEEESMAIE